MPSSIEKDFDFYVGGIEDAILAVLKSHLSALGIKTFETYSGDLDSEQLKKGISALTPKFPAIFVTYMDGKDVEDAKSHKVKGKAIHYRHDCSFMVVCVSNDARGNKAQRRGAVIGTKPKCGTYQMMSAVRSELGGLWLSVNIGNEIIPLTHSPLEIVGNEFIAKLPDITAYAVIFDTSFRFSTADRTVSGREVSEFVLEVESLEEEE